MSKIGSEQSFWEERSLLRELNHRINNEFAAAISAISLVAAQSENDEVKRALTGVTELLHRYADVHHALQMPEHDNPIDAGAYLSQLCLSLSLSKLSDKKIKLLLTTCPLWLQPERCWRLGMIVYELVTNAAKHAFSDGIGEIRVELSRADLLVECRVLDNGLAPAGTKAGQGMKIIDELSKGLEGQFEQRFGAYGSASILIFPETPQPR
jgi:two-component sensor histidine kinase